MNFIFFNNFNIDKHNSQRVHCQSYSAQMFANGTIVKTYYSHDSDLVRTVTLYKDDEKLIRVYDSFMSSYCHYDINGHILQNMTYDNNGNMITNVIYDEKTNGCLSREFYTNGNLRSEAYASDLPNYEITIHNLNDIRRSNKYEILWYWNQSVESLTFKAYQSSTRIVWWPNGRLKKITKYHETRYKYYNYSWDLNGNLLQIEIYTITNDIDYNEYQPAMINGELILPFIMVNFNQIDLQTIPHIAYKVIMY